MKYRKGPFRLEPLTFINVEARERKCTVCPYQKLLNLVDVLTYELCFGGTI